MQKRRVACVATAIGVALSTLIATQSRLHANVKRPLPNHLEDQNDYQIDDNETNLEHQYFPQALSCGRTWQSQYAQLHEQIIQNQVPPKYFVSMAVEAGTADRLTGLITQLYLALLSNRAFTMITYGDLPSFQAACDTPFINWTHPTPLDDEVVAPLKYTYKGVRGYDGDRSYDNSVNQQKYAQLYTINYDPLEPWKTSNLSESLKAPENNNNNKSQQQQAPYIIGASNRGRTYVMASNPFHKHWFWKMGLTPQNAFMCGVFFLCTPNKAVQDLYKSKYWDALSDTSALKISITVRTGDAAFQGEAEYSEAVREKMLSDFHGYFDCASKIEEAFSLRQQQVIWILNSDSLLLRRAAYEVFGGRKKVLTDLERKPVHPDCRYHNPDECETETQKAAMVHAMGQLFTSSMANYHISAKDSGFGRLAAWISGRWDNMYELDFGASCDPHRPTSVADSAVTWAGV